MAANAMAKGVCDIWYACNIRAANVSTVNVTSGHVRTTPLYISELAYTRDEIPDNDEQKHRE